jgi:hypothetical protein
VDDEVKKIWSYILLISAIVAMVFIPVTRNSFFATWLVQLVGTACVVGVPFVYHAWWNEVLNYEENVLNLVAINLSGVELVCFAKPKAFKRYRGFGITIRTLVAIAVSILGIVIIAHKSNNGITTNEALMAMLLYVALVYGANKVAKLAVEPILLDKFAATLKSRAPLDVVSHKISELLQTLELIDSIYKRLGLSGMPNYYEGKLNGLFSKYKNKVIDEDSAHIKAFNTSLGSLTDIAKNDHEKLVVVADEIGRLDSLYYLLHDEIVSLRSELLLHELLDIYEPAPFMVHIFQLKLFTRDWEALKEIIGRVKDNLTYLKVRVKAERGEHHSGNKRSDTDSDYASEKTDDSKVRRAYEVIGVPYGSSLKVVEKAWRKLAKQHHSDVGGDDAYMAKVNDAHDILKAYLA